MSATTTTTTTTTTQTSPSFGTTSSPAVPRGDTQAKLTFYKPPIDGSAPWNYVEQPPAGSPQRNFGEDEHSITVHDIRGHENEYDINVNGFGVLQGVESQVEYEQWDDDEVVKGVYYPEVEKLLLENVAGAERVFLFDHTIRRSVQGAKRAPVNRAHIDQTTKSAFARVDLHMGSESEELKNHRVRLINVWRPINGTVFTSPLAYADSQSVPDNDIVPVEHRYPTRTGETAGVKYSPEGKWHYWSGMGNEERILLQCFDSKDGARTPHSAFQDARGEDVGAKGRESIEVRALVFG